MRKKSREGSAPSGVCTRSKEKAIKKERGKKEKRKGGLLLVDSNACKERDGLELLPQTGTAARNPHAEKRSATLFVPRRGRPGKIGRRGGKKKGGTKEEISSKTAGCRAQQSMR